MGETADNLTNHWWLKGEERVPGSFDERPDDSDG